MSHWWRVDDIAPWYLVLISCRQHRHICIESTFVILCTLDIWEPTIFVDVISTSSELYWRIVIANRTYIANRCLTDIAVKSDMLQCNNDVALMKGWRYVSLVSSLIAEKLETTSIRRRSAAFASDRRLIDIISKFDAIWVILISYRQHRHIPNSKPMLGLSISILHRPMSVFISIRISEVEQVSAGRYLKCYIYNISCGRRLFPQPRMYCNRPILYMISLTLSV